REPLLPEPGEEFLHDLFGVVAGIHVGIRKGAHCGHVSGKHRLERALVARANPIEPLSLDPFAVVRLVPWPGRGHSIPKANMRRKNILRFAIASGAIVPRVQFTGDRARIGRFRTHSHGAAGPMFTRVLNPAREKALTRQAEDYLKVIYEIEQDGKPAATTDIAEQLGIAAASVSGMLQRLARLGLVTVERYRGARLSASGRLIALQ